MTWEPPLADPRIEADLERKEIPEADRDEVRRFSEFLRLRREKAPPAAEMKEWLLGEDKTHDG